MSQVFTITHKFKQCEGDFKAAVSLVSTITHMAT